jgi:hypothetical protein
MPSSTLTRPNPLDRLQADKLPPVPPGRAGLRAHSVLAELDALESSTDRAWRPAVHPLPPRRTEALAAKVAQPIRISLYRAPVKAPDPAAIPRVHVPPMLRESGSPVNRGHNVWWTAWFSTWTGAGAPVRKFARVRAKLFTVSVEAWRVQTQQELESVFDLHREAVWTDFHEVFGYPDGVVVA